jgi:AraC-like DNA-binding protein
LNCSFDFLHHTVREKQSYIDFHSHASFELVYYVSGRGTTEIGKETHRYDDRSFTLIQPGFKHSEFRETDTEVVFVCFYYDHEPISLPNGIYTDKEGAVHRILRGIMEELSGKKSYYDLTIQGLLCQLIVAVGRCISRPIRQEASDKVTYAKRFMEQYCSEKIDLQGLARSLGYSYDHFRHFFKQSTGYSPSQFMIRNRIEQAKRMLIDTDRAVTAIAFECGFSNAPQFSMMFRKDTGLPPKAYRDQFSRFK